jgi:hypothetical protein
LLFLSSFDDVVVRNCRENKDLVKLEHAVHCDCIWLHALRYSGKDWSFETDYPDWVNDFRVVSSVTASSVAVVEEEDKATAPLENETITSL